MTLRSDNGEALRQQPSFRIRSENFRPASDDDSTINCHCASISKDLIFLSSKTAIMVAMYTIAGRQVGSHVVS
jgi:hypothetical protein